LRTIAASALRRISKDNLSTLATAAAFYALLSIFPALTAVVSLYGLFADPAMVARQVAALEGVLPAEHGLFPQPHEPLLREPGHE
jgi:membrane protein